MFNLEKVVGRLTVALENFYKGVPREYKDYLKLLEDLKPQRIKEKVWFAKHQKSVFDFGEVYMYTQVDHIYIGNKVIAVRHGGWRVDTNTTNVIIMTDYHVDILDTKEAEAEENKSPSSRMYFR
jgi:hypothetical protein